MRLMHLGYTAYVVGEIVTPAIGEGDLLIIGSGSGETGSLVLMAEKAKQCGAKLALFTIYPESSIGKKADIVIRIPGVTAKSDIDRGVASIQPGGNLFEQTLLLLGDSIVIRIIHKGGFKSDNASMMRRHANLE